MTNSPHILVCVGTRPEAIKLAPVIRRATESALEVTVCAVAQHRGLLDRALAAFNLQPDIDLDVMVDRRTAGIDRERFARQVIDE